MRPISSWLGACLAAALMLMLSAPADAQTTRAVPLGSNDTGKGVHFDTSTGTAYVSGWNNSSGLLPRVWSISGASAVTTISLSVLPGGSNGQAIFFSPDGSYLAGYSDSASYSQEAARWTFGSWTTPVGTGVPSGSTTSAGFMASDSGHVVGFGGPGFCWAPMTQLPGFAGPFYNFTFAVSTSSDASIVAGSAYDSLGTETASYWSWNGAAWVLVTLADPYGIGAKINNVSPDGSLFAGDVTSTTAVLAALWDNGVLNIVPDDTGANLPGVAMQVTNDGTVFGQGNFGSGTQAFLWTENMGGNSQTLDSYYQQNNNNVPPPTSFIEIQQVKHAGGSYHIVVKGSNGLWYYVEVPEDAGCTCSPICQLLCWISKTWYGGNPPFWLQWYMLRFGCGNCSCC